MLDLSFLDKLPEIMTKSNTNFRWMLDNYGELVEKHPNEFIAIDGSKVIDNDENIEKLLKRMEENKTNSSSTIIEFVKKKS